MTRIMLVVLLLFPNVLPAREPVVAPVKGSASVTTCFTPGAPCDEAIVDLIRLAKRDIRVQAAYFTNRKIMAALVQAKERGVDVKVILPARHEKARSLALKTLMKAGIPIRIDYTHSKVMIFDKAIVLTGSYNFTNAAQRKSENIVILSDSPIISKAFLDQWDARWSISSPATLHNSSKGPAAKATNDLDEE